MNGRVLAGAFLFLSLGAHFAPAEKFLLTDHYGGTWRDAEKTGSSKLNGGDNLMCWAATAANILAWTGWDGGLADEDAIFQHFQGHWTNLSGNPGDAMEWWFLGQPTAMGSDSSVYQNGGGDFYHGSGAFGSLAAHVLFASLFRSDNDPRTIMDDMWSWMHEGRGVGLRLAWDGGGAHWLTAWGFDYTVHDNPTWIEYTGIYLTNSDDDIGAAPQTDALRHYTLTYDSVNNWWEIGTLSANHVTHIHALQLRVPEPAAVALWLVLLAAAATQRGRAFAGRRLPSAG